MGWADPAPFGSGAPSHSRTNAAASPPPTTMDPPAAVTGGADPAPLPSPMWILSLFGTHVRRSAGGGKGRGGPPLPSRIPTPLRPTLHEDPTAASSDKDGNVGSNDGGF